MNRAKIVYIIIVIILYKNSILAQLPFESYYLDTLTNRYSKKLIERGIRDYIIYSEINLQYLSAIGDDDCLCPQNNFILWKENSINHLIKYNSCYEYEYTDVNIDTINQFINQNITTLINQNKDSKSNKLNYIVNGYSRSKQIKKFCELLSISKNDTFYIGFPYLESLNDINHQLIQLFTTTIQKTAKKISQNKIERDTTVLIPLYNWYKNRRSEGSKRAKEYKNKVFTEWTNCKPISIEELKNEPKLVQEVYKFYEYLFDKDTFIYGENININFEYFIVPQVTIGVFDEVDSDLYKFSNLKSMELTNFRPRENKRAKKYLYMNKIIIDYMKNDYCKYGSFDGLFHTDSRLESGARPFFESPPAVRNIYFNKEYNQAYIRYQYNNSYKSCLLIKCNNEWCRFIDGIRIETD